MLYLILFLIAPIYAGVLLPTKPSIDPFYNAPEGFKNATVGDILQFRKTPKSITGGFVPLNVQNSWQFLVRSEDSFGNPNVIVTTVIEPVNADPSKILPTRFLKTLLELIVPHRMPFNLALM